MSVFLRITYPLQLNRDFGIRDFLPLKSLLYGNDASLLVYLALDELLVCELFVDLASEAVSDSYLIRPSDFD